MVIPFGGADGQTDGHYAYMAKIVEAFLDDFIERIPREIKKTP